MNQHRLAIAAIAAAAVLWGTTGTAAAFAPSVSALAVGAGAMGIGGLLQAIVNAGAIRQWRAPLRTNWATLAFGALCVAIYPLGFYTSMRVAGVAVGCVVSLASAPLASALLERILDARPLTKQWVVACICGISGAAMLCLPHGPDGGQSGNGTGSTAAGVALGLLAGFTYAGYSRALCRLMSRGIPRGAATGATFGLGGAALIPVLIAAGGTALIASTQSVVVILYLALAPMFLGYVLFGVGLGRVDATTATTTTLIEPAVATVTAVVVLGETITTLGLVGMALLAAALGVLLMPSTSRAEKAESAAESQVIQAPVPLIQRWRRAHQVPIELSRPRDPKQRCCTETSMRRSSDVHQIALRRPVCMAWSCSPRVLSPLSPRPTHWPRNPL